MVGRYLDRRELGFLAAAAAAAALFAVLAWQDAAPSGPKAPCWKRRRWI